MKKLALIIIILFLLTGCSSTCSKEKLETISSPNNKYTVTTYLNNCGATIDYFVTAELCTKNNVCIEIYKCIHEKKSSVYWFDNETVSINNKILNVKKDKYDYRDDENYQDKLYKE